MKKIKLGVVGATGLVGETILNVLKEENLLDCFELFLIASEKNFGKRMVFNGCEHNLLRLSENLLNLKLDVVIFSAGEEVSKNWVLKFYETGSIVIDNTNAFRKNLYVPLIVPEINKNLITKDVRLFSNPNCSTIQLAVVVDKLKNLSKIKKIVVSTYQSVSGAGRDALNDLKNGTNKVFVDGIKDEIIPFIGSFDENFDCTEESKIKFELNKILNESLDICATSVRVPTPFCHGESVYVEFEKSFEIDDVKNLLNQKHIKIVEDKILLKTCKNTNLTYVCRLRKHGEKELLFFVVADNLRRGAAYNAVEILKEVLKNLQ